MNINKAKDMLSKHLNYLYMCKHLIDKISHENKILELEYDSISTPNLEEPNYTPKHSYINTDAILNRIIRIKKNYRDEIDKLTIQLNDLQEEIRRVNDIIAQTDLSSDEYYIISNKYLTRDTKNADYIAKKLYLSEPRVFAIQHQALEKIQKTIVNNSRYVL